MLKHNLLMSLERTVALHITVMAILGAIFVGCGQEAIFVSAFTAVAAVAAFFVTDVWGRLRLKRWLANLLAIVAVAWSLREFFEIQSEQKLMAIADMLCYLQVVLLFQKKSARVFWQLVVLSILQVVVGAALDSGPLFGLLLGVYAVTALSTLALLCVYRELRLEQTPRRPAQTSSRPAWRLLTAEPQIQAVEISESDVARSLTRGVLVRQTALLTGATLLVAVVFFYATPRLSDSSWLGAAGAGGRAGFRPEARVAERGRIHLSSHVVMRVALSRMLERRPVRLFGEPYFHGEVLTEYRADERGSRWLPWQAPSSRAQRYALASMAPQTNRTLVRQDIVLESNPSGRRFAIVPTQVLADVPLVPYARSAGDVTTTPRQQRYSVATPAIRNDRQLHAIPVRTSLYGNALEEEKLRALEIDRDRFPRLIEVATEVLKQHDLTESRSLDKALALERHFLFPNLYRYSLNLDFTRDLELDPIEDFVANHRTGYCEYFASALVLMLRSQGIPARMVKGYKGGEYNTVGNYYVVQERHGHAWVEAWVPTSDVPEGEFAGVASEAGAWYRLDPTPGGDSYVVATEPGFAQRLAQSFDYVELLWRDYVLSLNNDRQEEMVYAPLTEQVGIFPSIVEARSLQRWLRRISRQFGLDLYGRGPSGGRSGQPAFEGLLAMLTIASLLLLLAFAQVLRFAYRGVRLWVERKQQGSATGQAPAFYKRLERILARLPLRRPAGQTAQELARAAQARLAAVEGAALTTRVPADVVQTYYRVRFGGARLDKKETEAIEQALASLVPAVRQARKQ
jgi:protein-glutamine gamma-glutamyltransferase